MVIVETKEGVELEVFVKPKSKEFRITIEGDDVTVHCIQEPFGGKVNKELVKELSRLFHRKVELISGYACKRKTLLVIGASKIDVQQVLTAITQSRTIR